MPDIHGDGFQYANCKKKSFLPKKSFPAKKIHFGEVDSACH